MHFWGQKALAEYSGLVCLQHQVMTGLEDRREKALSSLLLPFVTGIGSHYESKAKASPSWIDWRLVGENGGAWGFNCIQHPASSILRTGWGSQRAGKVRCSEGQWLFGQVLSGFCILNTSQLFLENPLPPPPRWLPRYLSTALPSPSPSPLLPSPLPLPKERQYS